MAIIGIVAVAQNLAIGKDGKLPWHYPADLKHFKQTTTGNAIVMGSNTWAVDREAAFKPSKHRAQPGGRSSTALKTFYFSEARRRRRTFPDISKAIST